MIRQQFKCLVKHLNMDVIKLRGFGKTMTQTYRHISNQPSCGRLRAHIARMRDESDLMETSVCALQSAHAIITPHKANKKRVSTSCFSKDKTETKYLTECLYIEARMMLRDLCGMLIISCVDKTNTKKDRTPM